MIFGVLSFYTFSYQTLFVLFCSKSFINSHNIGACSKKWIITLITLSFYMVIISTGKIKIYLALDGHYLARDEFPKPEQELQMYVSNHPR